MLKQLSIKNFQSHKESYLEFDPGMNVVLGSSDTGKSSIFRALYWVCQNRPSGNSFISNFSKGTAIATLKVDDNSIQRKKGKGKNLYIINEGEPLQALRSDLPDEIKSLTKVNSLNFQQQSENFFLLDTSPGKVAKKLNEIAGLQIMDKSLYSINSKIREVKQNVKSIDKDIENLNIEINNLNWIDACNKKYSLIEKQEEDLKEHKKDLEIIEEVELKYEEVQTELHKLPSVEALPKIEKILNLDNELYKVEKEIDSLVNIIDNYSIVLEKVEQLKPLENISLPDGKKYIDNINTMQKEIKEIDSLVFSFEKNTEDHDKINLQCGLLEKSLEKFKQDNPLCPVCGGTWL